ncbi:TPA_asm: hypothetical protein [Papaver atlanticum amalgavirus 1]|nr:TPA_asm: hypothetical protein [Papaver atlanticum amalgavirus 1]
MADGAESSGAARPYFPGGQTNPQDELTRILEPLVVQHFPVTQWNVAAVNASFLTTKGFIDTVKIFTLIPDEDLRRSLVVEAVSKRYFQSADRCDVRQMYNFCKYLRTAEGTLLINTLQKKKQLEKRALPGQSLAQVSLVAAFNEQRSEFSQALKERRNQHDAALSELRRLIQIAEEEKEADLHNVGVDFSPASTYKDMDEGDLNEACYGAYQLFCEENGREAAAPTDEILTACRGSYGDAVKSIHVSRFLDQGTNSEDLKVWVGNRILELEGTGERRKIHSFRSFLDNAGGAVDEQVRTAAVERSAGRRRDRPRQKRSATGMDPATIIPERLRRRGGAHGGPAQTAATNQQRVGAGAAAPAAAMGQPQDPGVEAAAIDEGGADPPQP